MGIVCSVELYLNFSGEKSFEVWGKIYLPYIGRVTCSWYRFYLLLLAVQL